IQQAQSGAQEEAGTEVVEHQVDAVANQLAQIGLVSRRLLAAEQLRGTELLVVVPVAGRDADYQAAQIFQAAIGVRTVARVEQHQLDFAQWFLDEQHLRFALGQMEYVQNTIGLPLLQRQQAAFPGQELQLQPNAQATQYFPSDFVVQAGGLGVPAVDMRGPGLRDETHRLPAGGEREHGQQESGDNLALD